MRKLVGTGQIGNGPMENGQCPNRQYGQWAKGNGQWATAHSIFLYPYILYIPDFPISHKGCLTFFMSPYIPRYPPPHRDIGDEGYSGYLREIRRNWDHQISYSLYPSFPHHIRYIPYPLYPFVLYRYIYIYIGYQGYTV